MNLFSWFLLGHLLADWLLQSDWMAIGKRQKFFAVAGLVHYAIYTVTILCFYFFLNGSSPNFLSILIIGLIIFVTHWLVDGTNLVQIWMRFYGQRDQAFVRIMIDQTLHLVVLGLVVLAIP